MRSLLPSVDYSLTSPFEALETLAFLQLPVPQVSSQPPISPFSDLLFLEFGSAIDVSLPIEKLPIENAVSKLLADVLPVDVRFGFEEDYENEFRSGSWKHFGFDVDEARLLELLDEATDEEKKIKSQITLGSETIDEALPKQSNERAISSTRTKKQSEVLQFEIQELDAFAVNASVFEKEGIQILSKAQEIGKCLEMPNSGFATNCPGVQESLLLVENIPFVDPVEQKADSEYDCSSQDQIPANPISFPTLEADEILLESIAGFSTEEKLLSYFQNIKLPHTQLDGLDSAVGNLLGRKERDTSEFLLNNLLSCHSFESENRSVDDLPELDLIRLVEISETKVTTDCSVPNQPILFQEIYFLDKDASQIFESLLNRQSVKEPETCSSMFSEDMGFQNFNSLVVSHELNLVDNTFKSLPIPVICDRKMFLDFYTIIGRKLTNLKPHPVSALDGIYLDWHLLEEDKHKCNTFYYQSIAGDMVSQSIDFEWENFDDKNAFYDFLFSDDSLPGFTMENNLETKSFLLDVSVSTGVNPEVKSSSRFTQSKEQNAKKDSGRSSLLFKSMSRSNDLEFFLNAQKAAIVTDGGFASRSGNTKPIPPKATPSVSISDGGESITIPDIEESFNRQKELSDDSSTAERQSMRAKDVMNYGGACHIALPKPSLPFVNDFGYPRGDMASLPETVIIVNTQNFDKEMIVSRRSTYQRILAIEKRGAQVVERDSNLPVDIIINSATCLVWYNCRNIGKKATALDEASSCLQSCIENIAANVLTLLSFSFSGCIMIFEGEDGFLDTVMEFSDGLYAAAASLGIVVQMFCSHSSDSTDEIIMNSLQYATRSVYPKMPESETLAESFLTHFPSVNPLTAHAILTSGVTLVDFLECSQEGRIRAIQKYNVPDESITLLGALCKYGEREDSRSIMTDCSSSVSSGTDSKSLNLNMGSKRKRRAYDESLTKSGARMNEVLHFDPARRFAKETMETLVEKPCDSFISKDRQTFHELRNHVQYERDLDVPVRMDPSVVHKRHDFETPKEPQASKKIRTPDFSFDAEFSGNLQGKDVSMSKHFSQFKKNFEQEFTFDDVFCHQVPETDEPTLKNFEKHFGKGSQALFDSQKDEVIDRYGSSSSGKAFSFIDDSISFLMPEMENTATGKCKTARRLSFDKNRQTTLPPNDQRHTFQTEYINFSDMDFGDDISMIKPPNKFPEENSRGFQFQEKESSPFKATPLSNALSFSTPGRKSPWTAEFLNKIRDKSRLRQQSLPCDASDTSFGFSESVSKYSKKKSPSILDFFKYQGGSTRRLMEQKKQKQSLQSASAKKPEKPSASASVPCTWTPQDKKARKTLSFTANSGERQTKLIWNDGTRNTSNKFRNQM